MRTHISRNLLAGLALFSLVLALGGHHSLAAPTENTSGSPDASQSDAEEQQPDSSDEPPANDQSAYEGEADDNKLMTSGRSFRDKIAPGSTPTDRTGPGNNSSRRGRAAAAPTVRTIWQRPEGGVGYECGAPGAGQWSCTVPKNSCEAAYVPPLHGQGEDTLLINQPHQAGTADPNKITQRGTRITLADGTRTDLGHRCITLGSPGTAAIPGAPPVVITVTREDFATLPVKPLEATAGPPDGWLPVNMVNVLHTDPTEQTLTTTLLGTPVQIRAIPIEYHWDLGDGNTITTTKPGKPFPSEEVSSTYRYEGWYDITLTTTFAGQFSVAGGPWQDIDGTITITSDPVPLYSASLTSRLTNPHKPTTDDKHTPDIPARTPDTEGPTDPNATHRTI